MKKFEDKEVKRLFNEIKQDVFRYKSTMDVNHKPHPYTIGPRHVKYASENWGGMLGSAAIRAGEKIGIRCAHKNCGLGIDEHTYDTVCFLQLKRNATQEEATEVLKQMNEKASTMYDGYCFVDTDEKFRIS